MSGSPPSRMTSDAFIAWTSSQSDGRRYELAAGEVVALAPERASHARVRVRVVRRFAEEIETRELLSETFADGMAVEVDSVTVCEPDAIVRSGPPLPEDAVKVSDPVVVVEILSPSARARDTGAKLEEYFRLPSVRHYVVVKIENRAIIHHARDAEGAITTRIIIDGGLTLDPPGLELRHIFD